VNFENTVIVMTTNAGSDKKGNAVGFDKSATEQSREKAEKALKEFLRPEFINRIDEIVYFKSLTEEDFAQIAKLMMDEMQASMAERGYALSYDDAVIDFLAKKSFSRTYGARNLRRFTQKEVEDKIAAEIVEGYENATNMIVLGVRDDGVVVSMGA